jgi:cytochrome d ubiquinol oxidase subunit I
MTVAASFGLASALSVVVLGDESGYTAGINQKMKVAAMEAMWKTEPAPASFTLLGWPNMKEHKTDYAITIPWLEGLMVTRSADREIPGIEELVGQARERIVDGLVAYKALAKLRADPADQALRQTVSDHAANLGFALLLKPIRPDIENATDADIDKAAASTIPNVPVLFWLFRFMVGIGFWFILFFATAFWLSAKRQLDRYKLFLYAAVATLPLPWIAAEFGWTVAEYGRQPWSIVGVLPTHAAVSATDPGNVITSLIVFVLFYSALAIADVFLLQRYIRIGPEPETAPKRQPAGPVRRAGG